MEFPSRELIYFIQQPSAKTVEILLFKRVTRGFPCNDQVFDSCLKSLIPV